MINRNHDKMDLLRTSLVPSMTHLQLAKSLADHTILKDNLEIIPKITLEALRLQRQ